MLRSINSSRLSSRTLMFSPVMHCYCRFYVTPGYSPLSINYISFISYDHRRDAGGESSLWPSGGCQVVSWSNSRFHDPNNQKQIVYPPSSYSLQSSIYIVSFISHALYCLFTFSSLRVDWTLYAQSKVLFAWASWGLRPLDLLKTKTLFESPTPHFLHTNFFKDQSALINIFEE